MLLFDSTMSMFDNNVLKNGHSLYMAFSTAMPSVGCSAIQVFTAGVRSCCLRNLVGRQPPLPVAPADRLSFEYLPAHENADADEQEQHEDEEQGHVLSSIRGDEKAPGSLPQGLSLRRRRGEKGPPAARSS